MVYIPPTYKYVPVTYENYRFKSKKKKLIKLVFVPKGPLICLHDPDSRAHDFLQFGPPMFLLN